MKRVGLGVCVIVMAAATAWGAATKGPGGPGGPGLLKPGQEYEGVKLDTRPANGGRDAHPTDAHPTKPLPTTVVIDEGRKVRPVTNQLLGFNDNWIHSDELAMEPGTNKINPAFVEALKGLPMPLNRMSGTDSQYFRWKWAVGPMSHRKPQKLADWLKPVKMRMGPLEWVAQTRAVDPNAKFDWVFNLRLDTPEDDADLARLFTAGPDDPWGKLRVDYGIRKPIDISIWELGNEMGHTWGWTPQQYVKECKRVIAAVRKVDPNARFAAMAASSPWNPKWKKEGRDWRQWHRLALKELGDDIDYLVFHPYYYGLSAPTLEKYLDVIRDDIHRITGSNRIKLFISEHARWPERPSKPGLSKREAKKLWQANWYQTHSLGGCLATATFLNRMLQRPEVTAACYHCLSGGPWGVIYRDEKTGEAGETSAPPSFWTTGIYDLFQLLNESLGEEVVATRTSGVRTDVTNNAMTFTVTAMTTDISGKRGLNLLMVNREEEASRPITFQAEKGYRVMEVLTLTGPSMKTHNTAGHDVLNVEQKRVDEPLGTYMMPPRSVVVLKCVAQPGQ